MECSLYVHIPFCTEKCDYCDFYSVPLGNLKGERAAADRVTGRYIEALLRETERRFDELRRIVRPAPHGGPDNPRSARAGPILTVPTIYIGGGTPSILGAAGMDRLLDGIAGITAAVSGTTGGPAAGPAPPPEITVEANPETADPAFLRSCAGRGVRRLSLGVQSFDPSVRRALGRRGCGGGEGAALLSRRLSSSAEIFGGGLSLDLMSGLPGQDEAALLADIEKALSYSPGHISLYALSVEEGTPLAARAGADETTPRPALPPPDEADALWLAGRDALVKAGYEHYEVSNFARPGKRCLHNIRYWRMENWIGVGSAASGTIIDDGDAPTAGGPASLSGGSRTSYIPGAGAFAENPFRCLRTGALERDTVLRETIMMGFRCCEGPDPARFVRRFDRTIEETIPHTLAKWKNFLRPGKTALSEKGLLFLNRFTLDAFEELDGG